MGKYFSIIASFIVVFSLMGESGYSQPGGGWGHFNPDSLVLVTVSGTAVVDTNMWHTRYFLDENGDDSPEYFLDFGPDWYQPDSGNATRPADGDSITIFGGMYDSINDSTHYPVIIVYEINGQFWRDPYEPFWCGFSHHHHHHHHHGGGFGFGWLHDSLQTVNINGVALVDTTFKFNLYLLDVNLDTVPDYFLNFGPPWYEPASGASRPQDGDTINIVGGMFEPDSVLPIVIVYEINGLTWRDSTYFGPYLGGGWISRYITYVKHIYSPWDSLCGMRIQPGWFPGGHHGMYMPDSVFGQMLQLFPENMPQVQSQNAFAGFEIGMFGPMGNNLMSGAMMGGSHFIFNNQAELKFHYSEILLQGNNINESTIQLKYWNDQTNSWINASTAILHPGENTVTLSTSTISPFYILTGQENSLSMTDIEKMRLNGFVLEQNYPNPFNPTTKIGFVLKNNAQVELIIYNVLGQKIADLLNQPMGAGQHSYEFSAHNLPSGSYFYELKVDGKSQIKKMYLIK